MKFQLKMNPFIKNENREFSPTDSHPMGNPVISIGYAHLINEYPGGLILRKLLTNALLVWVALFFTFNASAQEYYTQGISDNSFHVTELLYRLSYSGSYRDFKVPAEADGKIIYLEARGGDGGTIHMQNGSEHGRGGAGARVSGYFKIGSGSQEIPVGSTIRFIIGGAGGSATSTAFQIPHHAGGGGGGTGILFLPLGKDPITAGATDWTILMVASGGGGAYAKWGTASSNGKPGYSSELPPYTSISVPTWLADLRMQRPVLGWGAGIVGSGGGAGVELIKDLTADYPHRDDPIGNGLYPGGKSGSGGFQSVNGKWQPVGAAGGTWDKGQSGGFGFGSGGVGDSDNNPGGGGGYTGGDAGYAAPNYSSGFGGGSYINTAYCIGHSGMKVQNSTADPSSDGWVYYHFYSDAPVSIKRNDIWYKSTEWFTTILSSGGYTLKSWDDGNLCLYKPDNECVWCTNTANQNVYAWGLRNDGQMAVWTKSEWIWSAGTADSDPTAQWYTGDQYPGATHLVLTPGGEFFLANGQGACLKQLWSARW